MNVHIDAPLTNHRIGWHVGSLGYSEGCRCEECVLAYEADPHPFDHVWRWKVKLRERYRHPCRVTARGRLNSVRVEFPDGFFVITSRWAVRKA